MTRSTDTRSDWNWLENTYWYCPAQCMPAIQTQPDNTFRWVIDQTVWHITGYKDGYFWGVCSALLTPVSEEPDPDQKTDTSLFASITPDGQVHITFIRSALSTTLGTGCVVPHQGQPSFAMQMSSGPASSMAVHWAYMLQIGPGDPQWLHLPGAGVSVDRMLQGTTPPEPVGEVNTSSRQQPV